MSVTPGKNGSLESLAGSFNLAMFICRAWATSLAVFLHRDIGDRYLGWNAAAVLLLVPLYLLGWKGYDSEPMLLFLLAYTGLCCLARAGAVARRVRGEQFHSLYTGWPRFLGPKAKISELAMKKFWEPAVTFALGWAVREGIDAPLGTYLMLGGICLSITVRTSCAVDDKQALDLNDAVIEQEMIAERFREMRGDQ